MVNETNLNAVELLALSKMKIDVDRDAVASGHHDVDFSVRVTGTLSVGRDFESVQAAAVPWERIALLALSKMNESTRSAIFRAAIEGDDETSDEIKAEARDFVDRAKGKTKMVKRGRVTSELIMRELDAASKAA